MSTLQKIETEKEQLENVKKAGKYLLVICAILMIALAFNMYELKKYAKISNGEYIEMNQCMQICDEQCGVDAFPLEPAIKGDLLNAGTWT